MKLILILLKERLKLGYKKDNIMDCEYFYVPAIFTTDDPESEVDEIGEDNEVISFEYKSLYKTKKLEEYIDFDDYYLI